MAGYSGSKDDYLKRLRRVEGQIRGISRMVDEDTYCIDILTQVAAATKALQAVSLGLLEDHIGHCVVDAAKESDEAAAAKVTEASAAIVSARRTRPDVLAWTITPACIFSQMRGTPKKICGATSRRSSVIVRRDSPKFMTNWPVSALITVMFCSAMWHSGR